MKKNDDAIRAYIQRLQPQMRFLYRASHAVTGNRTLAEGTLNQAVLSAWLHRSEWRERMSFREGVLRAIREEGREQLRHEPEAEKDWPGVQAEAEGEYPLAGILAAEPQEVQRAVLLRFACSMSAREIAHLTGREAERVREELSRFQLRAERALRAREIACKPFDRYATQELRRWMNRENNEPIDVGYFLHAFEREADGTRQPRRIVLRVFRALFILLGALLLAVLVWLMAVLMEMS